MSFAVYIVIGHLIGFARMHFCIVARVATICFCSVDYTLCMHQHVGDITNCEYRNANGTRQCNLASRYINARPMQNIYQ